MMKVNSPLVSVIIPNYNHEAYLGYRIESILSQTYKNIEVIVLDDCSTDNSLDIVDKYRTDERLVSVIPNDANSGSPFAQWKKGLTMVKGDIVWIAESDDACADTFLEELVTFYLKNNLVMAFTLSRKMDLNGLLGEVVQKELTQNLIMNGCDYISNHISMITNASSAIFSRSCAQMINNNYYDYKGAGDWLFWTGIASQGNVGVLAKPLNYYRVHDKSTTSKMFSNGRDFHELRSIYSYLYNNGFWSKWTYLKKSAQMVYGIKNIFEFDDKEIKESLLKEWNGSSLINQSYCMLLKGWLFVNKLKNK